MEDWERKYDLGHLKDRLRTTLGQLQLRGEIREMLKEAEDEYHRDGAASLEGRQSVQAWAIIHWLRGILLSDDKVPPPVPAPAPAAPPEHTCWFAQNQGGERWREGIKECPACTPRFCTRCGTRMGALTKALAMCESCYEETTG